MTDKLLSGRRVLVAEDEMLILALVEDMLADLGCESITVAATVNQALALIDAQIFDAALLDINLIGKQSYSVADALAARGVPFAFSTGYSGDDMAARYRDRPVLKKPWKNEELRKIVTRLLSSRKTVLLGSGDT
jgi:CheY-like chemotaxis protein